MNKISCKICMDLIPLVKDDIASDDSQIAVEEHIKTCQACSAVYHTEIQIDTQMDDKIIVGKIKKKISYTLIAIILIGAVFGMMLTNSMNMFYNALIMPTIGGLGYMLLNKKVALLPVLLFLLSTVWIMGQSVLTGMSTSGADFVAAFFMAAFYSIIYAFFSLIGIVIVWLFQYAFRRDIK